MEELEKAFETGLIEMQSEAVMYFQKFIRDQGLIMTRELHDQLKQTSIIIASQLYAEIRVSFHSYGRFSDIKRLNYRGGKPDPESGLIEGLKKFILKKGVSEFNGIPGYYGGKRVPITSAAINRLAYAMAYSRVNRFTIRRRGDGWYNKGRSTFVRGVRRKLHSIIAEIVASEVAKKMEMEI